MKRLLVGIAALVSNLIRVRPIGDSAATRRARLYVDTWADTTVGGYDISVPASLTPPHCDSLVLHAPGKCSFCDAYPDIQANRVRLRIRFTGDSEPADWARCPAESYRDSSTIEQWPGNRIRP